MIISLNVFGGHKTWITYFLLGFSQIISQLPTVDVKKEDYGNRVCEK